MNSLNKAQVIGNITRAPELKQIPSGQSVCTVGVATNRNWTDSSGDKKEEVEFHNIVCWGKLAEICAEYLKKGSKVFFEGRLQTRSWEDDAGAKHYRTEIVANDMIMLSPKGSNDGGGGSAAAAAPKKEESGGTEVSAEDLPF